MSSAGVLLWINFFRPFTETGMVFLLGKSGGGKSTLLNSALELQGKGKDRKRVNELLKQVDPEGFARRKPVDSMRSM